MKICFVIKKCASEDELAWHSRLVNQINLNDQCMLQKYTRVFFSYEQWNGLTSDIIISAVDYILWSLFVSIIVNVSCGCWSSCIYLDIEWWLTYLISCLFAFISRVILVLITSTTSCSMHLANWNIRKINTYEIHVFYMYVCSLNQY